MGIISTSVSMTAVFDGENSVRLSLDNEHEDFLYSDSKELPVAPASGATSQAHLWDGKTEVSASDVTWAVDFTKSSGVPTSGTNKPECVSGLLTVKHITLQTAKVVVKATYPKTNGKDYFAEFTANRTKQDKYDLIVKPSSISYNSATYQPVAISLSAKRTDLQGNVSDVTISTSETLSEGNVYVFWAYVDSNGSIIGEPVNLKGTSKQVSKADAGSNMGVYFELRKYTSGSAYRLCDYETVEIAKAENGEPGKNSIRIDLSNQADLISCDSDGKARFARTITTVARIYDGGTLVGSGATASSATITVIRGGQSVDITSSPQYGSTGATYSWAIQYGDQMTQASYSVNISVTYNNATYNATFTLARTDWEAIYQISASPSAISFKYDSNGDLTPTSENLRLQYSKKTGTGTEIGNITNGNAIDNLLYPYYRIDGGSWYRWTDTQSGAITFSNGLMQVPSSVTWRNIEVCLSTSSSDPQDTNIIDREVIPVVKDGAAGDDGEDAAVAFATPGSFSVPCNADGSAIPATLGDVTFSLKVGQSSVPSGNITVAASSIPSNVIVNNVYDEEENLIPYIKNIVVSNGATAEGIKAGITFNVTGTLNNKTYSAPVTLPLIPSVKGADGTGQAGHVGRWFYYAGDWDESEYYYFESTRAPYVRCIDDNGVTHFYMLDCGNSEEPWSSYRQSDEDRHFFAYDPLDSRYNQGNPWSEMNPDFRYLITEATFSDYAHLGAFVYNGDWQISCNGTIDGVDYNSPSWQTPATYNGRAAYTWFDPSNPFTDHVVDEDGHHNFIPNFAVDGLTGKTYQNDAYVRGQVVASNGGTSIELRPGSGVTEIVGTADNNEVMKLGFDGRNGYLKLISQSGLNYTEILNNEYGGAQRCGLRFTIANNTNFNIGMSGGLISIRATTTDSTPQGRIDVWKTANNAQVGDVYLDTSTGNLKVKLS